MAEYIVRGTGTDGNPVYLNKKVRLDPGNPDKHGTEKAAQNVLKTFLGYNRTHAEVPASVRKSMRVVSAAVYERDKAAEAIAAAKKNGDGAPDGYFIRGRLASGGCRFLDCVGNVDLKPFVWKTKDAAVRVLNSFRGSGKLTEALSKKETASFAVIPYQKENPDAFLREAEPPARPVWYVAGQNEDGTFVYLTEDKTMSYADRDRALFSSRQEAQDFLESFLPKMKSPNWPWDTLPLACRTLAVRSVTAENGNAPESGIGAPENAPEDMKETNRRIRQPGMDACLTSAGEEPESEDGQEVNRKEKRRSLFPPLDEAVFSAFDEQEQNNARRLDGLDELGIPVAETEKAQESPAPEPDVSDEPAGQVQALSVLQSLLLLTDTDFSACERELCGCLSRADRAKSDVLHKIELSDDVDEEEAIGLLRKILKDRRAYKDALLLFQEFETAGGPQALSRLAKLKSAFPDRLYRPRVLTELFPETERNGEEN